MRSVLGEPVKIQQSPAELGNGMPHARMSPRFLNKASEKAAVAKDPGKLLLERVLANSSPVISRVQFF